MGLGSQSAGYGAGGAFILQGSNLCATILFAAAALFLAVGIRLLLKKPRR